MSGTEGTIEFPAQAIHVPEPIGNEAIFATRASDGKIIYFTKSELIAGLATLESLNNLINQVLEATQPKIPGKGLSTNDFTDLLKQKLDGLTNGGGGVAIGETEETAFRGDLGKIAYLFSQTVIPVDQLPVIPPEKMTPVKLSDDWFEQPVISDVPQDIVPLFASWDARIAEIADQRIAAAGGNPGETTPVPPTFTQVGRTFVLTHSLGASEIMYRDGANSFIQYTEPIQLGSTEHAAQQYSAKIKADPSSNRLESELSYSPFVAAESTGGGDEGLLAGFSRIAYPSSDFSTSDDKEYTYTGNPDYHYISVGKRMLGSGIVGQIAGQDSHVETRIHQVDLDSGSEFVGIYFEGGKIGWEANPGGYGDIEDIENGAFYGIRKTEGTTGEGDNFEVVKSLDNGANYEVIFNDGQFILKGADIPYTFITASCGVVPGKIYDPQGLGLTTV